MAKGIGDPRNKRTLGPDHDEVDPALAAEPQQALGVVGTNRMARRMARDTRVSRGSVELPEVSALREFPRERVLPSTRADNEDIHAVESSEGPGVFQRRARSGTTRAMRDPGLARHDWETEWAELEEDLEDSPREALSEVGDLIERMLEEQGIPIHDEVADDGIPHEVVADYVEARRITESVEKGEDVDPGDVGSAIRLYRELYDFLIHRIAE